MKIAVAGEVVAAEKGKLKRELTLLPLFGLIYFTVCGGSFGAGHARSCLDHRSRDLQPVRGRGHGIHLLGIDRHGNRRSVVFPNQGICEARRAGY